MEYNSLNELMDVLKHEMEKHQEPTKAVNMAAYLKGHFKCFGIKSPVRNEIQKKWFPELKKLKVDRWDVVCSLWELEQREYHYIAIDYLNKATKSEIEKEHYKLVEELITSHSWWDSVDSIASNYVGKYFQKFPEMKDVVIEKWRNSDNMWLNRTCIIFQLKYRNDVDFELMKSLILQYKEVKEFFIQKAIGWSLRQYSKFNPADVKAFVEEVQLEGLAKREATKYL